ncbi:MAG: DNA repair protein RecN [Pyrinomonadaceae bacterium]
MLKFLSITNLAVIDRLSFELHEGLNLLTGETGAGKSIIVDALSLLLGGRGVTDMVRTGERSSLIEGRFELKGEWEPRVRAILCGVGVETEEEEDLLIRRELQASGRSRIFVNDRSVTAGTLKNLQPWLVEIHGQGGQQSLTSARTHLEMLDSFAGCDDLRREAWAAYERWKKATEFLRTLERDEAARERASDMLRFQIAEIEKVDPRPGEDLDLAAERSLLAHAEKALELSAGAYSDLYESDQSVLAQIALVRRRLHDLSLIDNRVASLLEGLEGAAVALTDVAEALRGYGLGDDFSPARLTEVEDRLAEIERLKRKHGQDVEGLLEVKDRLRRELQQMSNLAERERELQKEIEDAARAYGPVAARLTEVRREAAARLEKRVAGDLGHVALERARFMVLLETAGADGAGGISRQVTQDVGEEFSGGTKASYWSPVGSDRAEFLFSANVGESVRPLGRVASGGELSRLMLTLRNVCREGGAGRCPEPGGGTLVFDEIDTGIGGRVAEAVGRRLKALAAAQQVLCVTHQPQLARFADHHYLVAKRVEGERTLTSVRELSFEERVGELTRMIGGAEELAAARETARWMLEDGAAEVRRKSRGAARAGETRRKKRL